MPSEELSWVIRELEGWGPRLWEEEEEELEIGGGGGQVEQTAS